MSTNPYLAWCKTNKKDFTDVTAWQDFFDTEVRPNMYTEPHSKKVQAKIGGVLLGWVSIQPLVPDNVTDAICYAWRQNREVILDDSQLGYSQYAMKPVSVFAYKATRAFCLVGKGVTYHGQAGDYIVDFGTHRTVMSGEIFEKRFSSQLSEVS